MIVLPYSRSASASSFDDIEVDSYYCCDYSWGILSKKRKSPKYFYCRTWSYGVMKLGTCKFQAVHRGKCGASCRLSDRGCDTLKLKLLAFVAI